MSGRRDIALPGWPRGLSEPLAAAYVGLSESQWRIEVNDGRAPQPQRITPGRKIWLKDDLDTYLDRLFGKPHSQPQEASLPATSLRKDLEEWHA